MIDAAETTYLVADSSKIGQSSLASLGALSLIDCIITDEGISEAEKEHFSSNDIELVIASL